MSISLDNPLHSQLARLVSIEDDLARKLAVASPESTEVADLVGRLQKVAQSQHSALETRLGVIANDCEVPEVKLVNLEELQNRTASEVLRHLYVSLSAVVYEYSALRPIAFRFRDSPIAGPENTAILVKEHLENYMKVIREISQLLHDVVVDELEAESISCRCTCACCGIGLCICASHSRRLMSDEWTSVGPISDESELYLHPPREGSPAKAAGLAEGDVIVGADGKTINDYLHLVEIIDGHSTGEAVALQVRRGNEEVKVSLQLP